jgi:hypothetical protein
MNLNEVPISISGIDYVMNFDFFRRLNIIEETLIDDTYFIRVGDQKEYFHLSVHKNYYDIIKRDLKINKIFE